MGRSHQNVRDRSWVGTVLVSLGLFEWSEGSGGYAGHSSPMTGSAGIARLNSIRKM